MINHLYKIKQVNPCRLLPDKCLEADGSEESEVVEEWEETLEHDAGCFDGCK